MWDSCHGLSSNPAAGFVQVIKQNLTLIAEVTRGQLLLSENSSREELKMLNNSPSQQSGQIQNFPYSPYSSLIFAYIIIFIYSVIDNIKRPIMRNAFFPLGC